MTTDDPDALPRIDQEIRINELKHKAEALADGDMAAWEADDLPPGMSEQFWEQVVAYEQAPSTSHFQQLLDAGVELPAPDALGAEQLPAKLWEVIDQLARLRVFLSSTDHLSDRELYALLWSDLLREETMALPGDDSWACQLDVLGGGSEEQLHLHLKYYADADWRAQWASEFPDYALPDHEDPPYDRDRRLPQATYG